MPDFESLLQAEEQRYSATSVADPTVGLYSATNSSKGAQLSQVFTDGLSEIIRGTCPLSELESLVSDWRNSGGDMIRNELQQALSAAS